MEFIVYTDGGCSGNRRDDNCPGGFGYIILDPAENVLCEGGGKRMNTTNNRMEMQAVIQGMTELKKELDECHNGSSRHGCLVVTDSKYVCENWEDYLPGWKKNGWRKSSGSPVINKDLWKEIDALTPEFRSFRFQWVKGHAKNRYNERADAIVQRYMKGGQLSTQT